MRTFLFFVSYENFLIFLGADPKVQNFNKVYMRTHRRSGLLISMKNQILEKLFLRFCKNDEVLYIYILTTFQKTLL